MVDWDIQYTGRRRIDTGRESNLYPDGGTGELIARRASLIAGASPLLTAQTRVQKMLLLSSSSASLPQPSLDLNLLAGPLDGRITFTRVSTATYFDASGTLQTATAGTPRFDADPVTHAARGIADRGGAGPMCWSPSVPGRSGATRNASGTGTNTNNAGAAPDGTTTATRMVADATNGVHGYALTTTPAGNTVYTQSIYAKAGTSPFASIEFRTSRIMGRGCAHLVVNLNTGAITATVGTATGTITAAGNGWYRITITATTTAAPAHELLG